MDAKIIDVDFKKKRVNFSFGDAVKVQQVNSAKAQLKGALVDIHKAYKDDKLYLDCVTKALIRILHSLENKN